MNDVMSKSAVALAALAFVAAPAAAQSGAGWLPWVGCWQAEGDATGADLCVRPTGADAVELVRIEAGEIVATETLWADGEEHATVREDCTGWERGRFSDDGRRIFYSSEHACEEGGTRSGAGIMTLVSPTAWLDVRVVEVGGEPTAWVQRYRAVEVDADVTPELAQLVRDRARTLRAAKVAASAPLDLDDVFEASARVPAEAVEAWLAGTGDELDVTAEDLIALQDAGVPDRVIDVVVAVSHPERFALNEGRPEAVDDADMRARYPGDRYGYGGRRYGGFWGPYGYGRWGYDPFYYGYGPVGYPRGGYYGGFYGYRPVVISVRPSARAPGGRAIAGRGYRRPFSGQDGGTPAVGRSGGDGASGSGSGGGGARTAKPRTAKKRGSGG